MDKIQKLDNEKEEPTQIRPWKQKMTMEKISHNSRLKVTHDDSKSDQMGTKLNPNNRVLTSSNQYLSRHRLSWELRMDIRKQINNQIEG